MIQGLLPGFDDRRLAPGHPEQDGVDRGRGFEIGPVEQAQNLDVPPGLQQQRRAALRGIWPSHIALRVLAPDYEVGLLRRRGGFHQLTDDGGCLVEGDMREDFVKGRGEGEPEEVLVDQLDMRRCPELRLEVAQQRKVQLYADQLTATPGQLAGERAASGSDLHDDVLPGDGRVRDEASCERAAPQEVLGELRSPLWPVSLPGHGWPPCT